MKYVIFRHSSGTLMPVIIPQHVTHSMVKLMDCKPISAGFFHLNSMKQVIIEDLVSESLKLGALPGDAKLLEAVIDNYGIYAFVTY